MAITRPRSLHRPPHCLYCALSCPGVVFAFLSPAALSHLVGWVGACFASHPPLRTRRSHRCGNGVHAVGLPLCKKELPARACSGLSLWGSHLSFLLDYAVRPSTPRNGLAHLSYASNGTLLLHHLHRAYS